MSSTDSALLQRFVLSRDESAFEELVSRHLGLVMGAARRRLRGREDLAEEIAQNVFIVLARKAPALKSHPCLAGWLHKTATFQASRAARKEQTRSHSMSRLQTELNVSRDLASAPDEMEQVLPVLDDALASLNEGDRRTLLMRFYEGKSFKAIAALVGKTEVACQKQSRRALEKLGSVLRRRGATVSLTALATGLGSELGRATPVTQAATISQSALSNSSGASLSATGLFLQQLTLMNTKSATLAGAIIVIACAGTGYLTGTASRPKSKTEPVSAAPPKPASPSNTSSALTSPRGERRDLEQLLALAHRELQQEVYDIVAGTRARTRLAFLSPQQLPLALELIDGLPGGHDGHPALTDAILERWAQFDGKAACDFCLEHRKPLTMGIPPIRLPLTAWAGHDPESALAWYLEKSAAKHPSLKEEKAGRFSGIANIRWVIGAWLHHDIDGAIAAYETLESEEHRSGARIAFQEQAGPLPDRTKLLDYFLTIPKSEQEDVFQFTLSRWAIHHPEDLAKWIDQNDVEELRLPDRIMRFWLQSDSSAAVDWWLTRESSVATKRRTDKLIDHWANADSTAAGNWLAERPFDADHEPAFTNYARRSAFRDPAGALNWGSRIEDAEARAHSLELIVTEWAKKKPEEAREHLDDAELPASEKQPLYDLLPATSTEDPQP